MTNTRDFRLAEISHWRCDEPSATTYVWVPKDWLEDRFEDAVSKAEKAYEEALKGYRDDVKPYPNASYFFDASFIKTLEDKNVTIAEAEAEWERQKEENSKWQRARDKAHKPFTDYLRDEGLIGFYDIDPEYSTSLFWGHRHGETIAYEDTDPNGKDLKKPLEIKRGRWVRKGGSSA